MSETQVPDTVAELQSNVQVIEVQNPTAEEFAAITHEIKAKMPDIAVKQTQFNFKKTKDKDTQIEIVRKPVILALPYPTVAGIIAILETGGKELELLMEAVEGVVNSTARDLLADELELNAATFPVEKLSWAAIANMPKAARRGGGIPKETWEAFAADYMEVMQAAAGKTVEQATNAAKLLLNKFQTIKTNEPVLKYMLTQLGLYAEASANLAEYQDCVEFLMTKADAFMNVSEEDLLQNL